MVHSVFQLVHAYVCHIFQLPGVFAPLPAVILLKGTKFSKHSSTASVDLGQGITLSRVFCDLPSPLMLFAACIMSCIVSLPQEYESMPQLWV